MLIPSIDLVRGQAVRLRHGRELELVVEEDPRKLARRLGRAGEIAVIDLDAARGTGDNLRLVEELCGITPCRVGGGIRDLERGRALLRAGARRLIIGTSAEPDFLGEFPRRRILAALDARDGQLLESGWERLRGESLIDRARRLEPHVGGFVYTAVDRQGTMAGVDIERVQTLATAVAVPVTAAGGVHTTDEIRALDRLGVDAQVGMALSRGAIGLGAGVAAAVEFGADDGRVPAVVQDAGDARVLAIVHLSRDALVHSVDRGAVGVHGNHALVRVEVDCDRDALLLLVEAGGTACTRGEASCFGDRPFSLAELERIIAERAAVPEDGSYTGRLLTDAVTRRAKILEEANELVDADGLAAIRGEAADLLYHLLVDLAARGVPLRAVIHELEARRRRPPA